MSCADLIRVSIRFPKNLLFGRRDGLPGYLERDDFSSNRHPALSFCLSMISAQTLRVCREGKPVPTFPDHALADTVGAVIGFKPGADRIDFGGKPLHFAVYPKTI